jgi:hypothetical protein
MLRSALRLLLTATIVHSSRIVTLTNGAIHSSETSVLTRPTRRNIQEDGILHSHRRENRKSYNKYYVYLYTHYTHVQMTYGQYNINCCNVLCSLHKLA